MTKDLLTLYYESRDEFGVWYDNRVDEKKVRDQTSISLSLSLYEQLGQPQEIVLAIGNPAVEG